ncbi:DNA alkylation repair protein [Mucilaginibacter sp. BT774]|uniref:DNA alkylation repair protein n=1 Tax=Mucilaginibacter sp. BT774 TaxID=3062276 RepID=UPI002675CF3B|nr:DNA alkylation repair protein [Mucilaginibacter sp. BT774]MDO3626495.1 DNA alkylation repair protein [Mucilaginibacter sp. BT774]
MTVQEIMDDLKAHGSDSIKKILLKHGVKEPFFGVKIEYMKPIQKKVKMDYQLAKDLYATGNADAMYLAGLIADDDKMTKSDLQTWATQAVSNNISEYTVPWVATGNKHGFELALEWIDSPEEYIAAAGWSTLSNLVSFKPDNQLDISELRRLLARVAKTIHSSANRVRSTMNGFLIAVGTYVAELSEEAIATAKNIGAVMVEKEGTSCKVPDAAEYILKAKNKNAIGKKKKTVKC